MSYSGMRGPFTDFIFTGIRLLTDQTLENWTGAGALPWTWPVNEQVIDIVHKGIFALVTGFVGSPWTSRPSFAWMRIMLEAEELTCSLALQVCDRFIQ